CDRIVDAPDSSRGLGPGILYDGRSGDRSGERPAFRRRTFPDLRWSASHRDRSASWTRKYPGRGGGERSRTLAGRTAARSFAWLFFRSGCSRNLARTGDWADVRGGDAALSLVSTSEIDPAARRRRSAIA